MQPWMQPDVVDLMAKIDRTQDWNLFIFLADALMDAHHPDWELCDKLRAKDPYLCGRWYRRVAEGVVTYDQVVKAKDWLTQHAAAFHDYEYDDNDNRVDFPGQTFEWMMEVCERWYIDSRETCLGYQTPDEAYRGAKEMWDHFEILTGCRPPDENWGGESYPVNPFRCAC